ncbi:hypothetical protein CB467_15770 [Salmonella enterica subsp. enterica serovar Goverdhan]|nr:hypothetical protein [Salmonella enterica subsp. enterica serovar Goverdhan]
MYTLTGWHGLLIRGRVFINSISILIIFGAETMFDYRDMIQLRRGISRARSTFEGFGSLRDSDFSKRTANRPIKKAHPIYSSSGVQMVIAPHIVHKMQQQGNL